VSRRELIADVRLASLTSDLQIVDSGLNKAIIPTTGKLTGIDTTVVAGAGLRVRF
jgi:hypothetical protein